MRHHVTFVTDPSNRRIDSGNYENEYRLSKNACGAGSVTGVIRQSPVQSPVITYAIMLLLGPELCDLTYHSPTKISLRDLYLRYPNQEKRMLI